MCWSATASVAMVGLGSAAATFAALRGEPRAIWLTLGYFTAMEGLQAVGYSVVDSCGTAENRAVTLLSYLHIAFQPLVINAFAMAIAPAPVAPRVRRAVLGAAALCTALMLFRLVPVDWAGQCLAHEAMCSERLCTVSGNWHIAWEVPLNGLYNPLGQVLGFGIEFPDYFLAVFLLPLAYGAWRFVMLNLAAGPVIAFALTSNPNERPAVWCLFSVALVLVAVSPFVRHRVLAAHRVQVA